MDKKNDVLLKKSKAYMLANYEYCIDHTCDVLNTTKLAEMTADEYDIYEDEIDYEIPEWVYDLAIEIESGLIKKGICQY